MRQRVRKRNEMQRKGRSRKGQQYCDIMILVICFKFEEV